MSERGKEEASWVLTHLIVIQVGIHWVLLQHQQPTSNIQEDGVNSFVFLTSNTCRWCVCERESLQNTTPPTRFSSNIGGGDGDKCVGPGLGH